MDYRIAFLQLMLLVVIWFVENLIGKVFHFARRRRHVHSPVVWTIILWLLSVYNIASLYWIAYPIAIWMIAALLLIVVQTVHYGEFIYRRYWPVFWRLSVILAAIFFVGSLLCQNLPLV